MPELQACCAVSDAAGGPEADSAQRMGSVLEWLQVMLVEIELGDATNDEDDELDEGFVSTARPWLHTKEFFDIPAAGFADELWQHLSGAGYLQPKGEGGTLLLLLPSRLPFSLFQRVTDTVRDGAVANLNADLLVSGYHPDGASKESRSPVPLIQVFLDSPDLLVDGGSMSDAAGFL